jgi:hypothetical protein
MGRVYNTALARWSKGMQRPALAPSAYRRERPFGYDVAQLLT